MTEKEILSASNPLDIPEIAKAAQVAKDSERKSLISDYFFDFIEFKGVKFFYPTLRHHMLRDLIWETNEDIEVRKIYFMYSLTIKSSKLAQIAIRDGLVLPNFFKKAFKFSEKFTSAELGAIFDKLADVGQYQDEAQNDNVVIEDNNYYWWAGIVNVVACEYGWTEKYILDEVPYSRLKEYIFEINIRNGGKGERKHRPDRAGVLYLEMLAKYSKIKKKKLSADYAD